MTTNQLFTELVQRITAGGNVRDDFPFDLGDFMAHLDFAYATAVKYRMNEIYSMQRVVDIDSGITRVYDLDVSEDKRGKYSKLPVSVLRLSNDLGVYRVGKGGNVFARSSADIDERFVGLAAEKLSPKTKFWLEGDEIRFRGPVGDCVDANLIPFPSSLEDDQEILFPAGGQDIVLNTIMQRLGFMAQNPEDPNNNGKK